MIRKVFSLLPVVLIAFGVVKAQVQEPCGTMEANNTYKKYAPEIEKYEQELSKFIAQQMEKASDRAKAKGTAFGANEVLHIPLVVHVVHNYGAEYVTDNEIYQMVEHINEVFMKRNSDTSAIIQPFKKYIGNPNVTFHLAAKDPKGKPTNGITRHHTYLSNGGDDQAKLDQWDPSSYLNIWITGRIGRSPASGQILAYAVFPSSAAAIPYTDGILAGYQFINRDKTIPHEIGHILNLFHTWGNVAVATNCDGDDEVDDTPPTTGHFGNGSPYGASASADCNQPVALYDTSCVYNAVDISKILLDSSLSPTVGTQQRGFDYIPRTNLSIQSVNIYPSSIGEEFEITHYKQNASTGVFSPIKVLSTQRDTIGKPVIGSRSVVSTNTYPNQPAIQSGIRFGFGQLAYIDSFSIYPTTIGDTFVISLLRFNGDTINTYTGVTSTNSGPQVVPFNTYVVSGAGFNLVMSRNPGLKSDTLVYSQIQNLDNNNLRPYIEIPGAVGLTRYYDTTGQESANNANSFKGRYNFFYDIHIRYGALTTTDSSAQTVVLDSFIAIPDTAYRLRVTKNPGLYHDSIGAAPYVKSIQCVIDIRNETEDNRYNFLYRPKIRYGYIKNCIDYPDTVNTQNIMDYSDCPIMFTDLQVERMRTTLASSVGNRNKLVNDTTHVRTGILNQIGGGYVGPGNRPDLKPVPAVSVERNLTSDTRTYYMCKSANFSFQQRSWRDTVTSVTMSFSNSASAPSITQTSQFNSDVTNQFGESGWVDVTVKATGNGSGDSTVVYENLVYAADPDYTINPLNGFFMDFEQGDANNPLDKWPTFNYYNNDYKWEVLDNVGFTGSGCISYRAYDQRTGPAIYNNTPKGDFDDFFTPGFDLTGMNDICRLNFMTSGATRAADSRLMKDTLEISYSTDCGQSWEVLESLTKADIANKGVVNIQYAPLWHGDWKLQSIDIPQAARGGRVFFRFRFKPGADDISNTVAASRMIPGTGNHFYLDRINISPYALGVNTLLTDDRKVALAPNPTTGSSQLIIKSSSKDVANVQVTDVTGKVVYTIQHQLNGNVNTIEIPASAIQVKGVYMVHVKAGDEKFTEKLVSY